MLVMKGSSGQYGEEQAGVVLDFAVVAAILAWPAWRMSPMARWQPRKREDEGCGDPE
jgi:hypothetical protein